VNVFTEGLPEVTFSASLDTKGRITVPARIRNRLGIDKGDEIFLSLKSEDVVRKDVNSLEEALIFVKSFDSVSSFSFSDGVVEVILDE
jgi:AbrB family looped-hinge helix DNA binding protein